MNLSIQLILLALFQSDLRLQTFTVPVLVSDMSVIILYIMTVKQNAFRSLQINAIFNLSVSSSTIWCISSQDSKLQ